MTQNYWQHLESKAQEYEVNEQVDLEIIIQKKFRVINLRSVKRIRVKQQLEQKLLMSNY